MNELKQLAKNFVSRKWIVTVAVLGMAYQLPLAFKKAEVNDMVTMMVLGIIVAAGVAYGVLNVKDSKPNG